MSEMTDQRDTSSRAPASQAAESALPIDESRLTTMRRVKRMPLEERIALLDRLCLEGTRIATRARRIK
jgi:hypothetical protein